MLMKFLTGSLALFLLLFTVDASAQETTEPTTPEIVTISDESPADEEAAPPALFKKNKGEGGCGCGRGL